MMEPKEACEAGVALRIEFAERRNALGMGYVHTARIHDFLIHPGFPVDIRHNAKIGREKLAVWATTQLEQHA